MTYEVTVTAETLGELADKLSGMGSALSAKSEPILVPTPAPRGRPPRAAPAPVPAPEPVSGEPMTVEGLVDEVVKAHGTERVSQILGEFGVKRISLLSDEQFPIFVEALREALLS